MTVKGGTTPACAACKYQRRKCSHTCPLAPYFPADQPKIFQNIHRLFGVSKVTKTLKDLETKDQRDDAMQSIKYEADMRQRFPVDGCRVVIAQLHQKLQLAYEELHYVCANLDACRLANMDGSSSGKDAAAVPPPHHGGGQFVFDESGLENVPTVSWIQAQMNALDIHKRSSLDFEAQQFKNYVVSERMIDEEMPSRFSQIDFEAQRFKNYAVVERNVEEMSSRFSQVARIREERIFYENDLNLNASNASKYYETLK